MMKEHDTAVEKDNSTIVGRLSLVVKLLTDQNQIAADGTLLLNPAEVISITRTLTDVKATLDYLIGDTDGNKIADMARRYLFVGVDMMHKKIADNPNIELTPFINDAMSAFGLCLVKT
jgi:hypothetical protein